jgi:hypothetical protein
VGLGHVQAGGQTCLKKLSGIWLRGQISPARDLDDEVEVGPGHVWAGARTCPEKLSGIRSENRYVSHFWEFWLEDSFRCFALHQLTQCIPLDSTELLGHK